IREFFVPWQGRPSRLTRREWVGDFCGGMSTSPNQGAAPNRRLRLGLVPWSFGFSKSQGSAVGELGREASSTMITLLRHLLAIVTLPFMVAVLVPFWIAGRYGVTFSLGRSISLVIFQVAGLVLFSFGLVL